MRGEESNLGFETHEFRCSPPGSAIQKMQGWHFTSFVQKGRNLFLVSSALAFCTSSKLLQESLGLV
jgi:hypothetical protein